MEMRKLGRSGLHVSALSFGAMTFGGEGMFRAVGDTGDEDAKRLIGMCIDAGVNLFDTADAYSNGTSEEILGRALGQRRPDVLIATKAFGAMGKGPNNAGTSRHHVISACEASLRRLGTDYIDLYQMHGFDALTPLDETLRALDDLVRAGKVRYIGCSNYFGWQLMKALAWSDAHNLDRYVSQQIYYSLAGRDAEMELVPLGLDQGVGIVVWSPLAFGLLTGKFKRNSADPEGARAALSGAPGGVDRETIFDLVDLLSGIAEERGVPVAQVALNYLLAKPCVSTVLIGARNAEQLEQNLGAASWSLSGAEMATLDKASTPKAGYPAWFYQAMASDRNPYFKKK